METKEVHDQNEHMQTAVKALQSMLALSPWPATDAVVDAVRKIAAVAADVVEHRAQSYFEARALLDDATLDRLDDNDQRWVAQAEVGKVQQRLEIATRMFCAMMPDVAYENAAARAELTRVVLAAADELITAASDLTAA